MDTNNTTSGTQSTTQPKTLSTRMKNFWDFVTTFAAAAVGAGPVIKSTGAFTSGVGKSIANPSVASAVTKVGDLVYNFGKTYSKSVNSGLKEVARRALPIGATVKSGILSGVKYGLTAVKSALVAGGKTALSVVPKVWTGIKAGVSVLPGSKYAAATGTKALGVLKASPVVLGSVALAAAGLKLGDQLGYVTKLQDPIKKLSLKKEGTQPFSFVSDEVKEDISAFIERAKNILDVSRYEIPFIGGNN